MPPALFEISNGAETASLEEWKEYYRLPLERRVARLQALRDPLRAVNGRYCEVIAVYGFELHSATISLVYFWHHQLLGLRAGRGRNIEGMKSYLVLGMLLNKYAADSPHLSPLLTLCDSAMTVGRDESLGEFDGLSLYWYACRQYRFACLFDPRKVTTSSDSVTPSKSSTSLLECLTFNVDYFAYRSPYSMLAPARFMFKHAGSSADALERLLLHPKCFDPQTQLKTSQFSWPWQRCLVHADFPKGHSDYSSIETTSLVTDLRRSTAAMGLLESGREGEFSRFIDQVNKISRRCIVDFGGFYDKETGDGVVAHFCDFEYLSGAESIDSKSQRAFKCANEIVSKVKVICANFQKYLKFEISNLGPSIGIHTGKATWLFDGRQVRAIGESVVVATRLCESAQCDAVFLSGSQYRLLQPLLDAGQSADFVRSRFYSKDGDQRSELIGFMYKEGIQVAGGPQ